MTKDQFSVDGKASFDPIERVARTVAIKEMLQSCLEALDNLALWQTGAHVTMALTSIETEWTDVYASSAPATVLSIELDNGAERK